MKSAAECGAVPDNVMKAVIRMMMINDDDDDDLPGHLDADGLDPGDDLARGDARPHLEPLVRPVRHHEPKQSWHLCCRGSQVPLPREGPY